MCVFVNGDEYDAFCFKEDTCFVIAAIHDFFRILLMFPWCSLATDEQGSSAELETGLGWSCHLVFQNVDVCLNHASSVLHRNVNLFCTRWCCVSTLVSVSSGVLLWLSFWWHKWFRMCILHRLIACMSFVDKQDDVAEHCFFGWIVCCACICVCACGMLALSLVLRCSCLCVL